MIRLLIAGALALALAAPAIAQDQKPLTPESMWALARVGAPALSPDGATAIVPVARFDLATDRLSSDLFALPTAGGPGKQLTSNATAESDVAWSPDGKTIAFVTRREGDAAPQIYLLPVDGGEARRLTSVPTGVQALKWSRDSASIAFLTRVWTDLQTWPEQAERLKARAESRMTARVWDKPPVTTWDRFVDDRQWHVYFADIATGAIRPGTLGSGRAVSFSPPDDGSDAFDLSPDGRTIVFVSDTDTTGTRPNLDIYAWTAGGAGLVNLTAENPAPDTVPLFSPDGRFLAFGQQKIYGFYADRVRLMVRDVASGRVRDLSGDWDRSASGMIWTPDSRALLGAIDDTATRRIYRFNLAGGPPQPVTTANDFGALAMEGSTLVALRQSFSDPGTLVRVDPRTGAATPLTGVNDAALRSTALGSVESVTYAGANGAPIQMWVVKPPGFDPSKKYPLFLLLHGGPHNAITDSWTFRWNAHVFAAWGYVVAWHNFHGSSGFGQAFADSINPNRADLPYQDTIKAAEWFASQPWIDPERMVAGGGSYGGYLASTLLGRPHPFKALIAHAAVYNNYTQVAADYGGGVDRFWEYWERPEEFQRYSPHMAAGNFNTPTLVIHGQLDYRVPVNHGIELFHTLQKRGVPSRLVYYPDENHWILKPQNSVFWYSQVRDWIERYAPPGGR